MDRIPFARSDRGGRPSSCPPFGVRGPFVLCGTRAVLRFSRVADPFSTELRTIPGRDRMRSITFVVPDPPPIREHPGQAAGRDSPHAELLVEAAEALVAEDPDAFPWQFSGMTVRFGRTMWNVDPLGYQPGHPLFEVLCNVGAICDPDGWWSYTSQDPDAEFYVVTFASEEPSSASQFVEQSFTWTEVPPEFHGSPPPNPPPGT